jgi:hypothetical protein
MRSQALPVMAPPPSHGLHAGHASRPRILGALKGGAS